MSDALNIFDLEKLAKENLPQTAYDYYSSGAWDEITLRENRDAFSRIQVHYKVMVDVSKRDLSTTIFGQRVSMPILLAPTAFHKLAHPDGEVATVRAAGASNTIMTLSSLSTTKVEEFTAELNVKLNLGGIDDPALVDYFGHRRILRFDHGRVRRHLHLLRHGPDL